MRKFVFQNIPGEFGIGKEIYFVGSGIRFSPDVFQRGVNQFVGNSLYPA
jgi:hypothetical protein